MGKTLEINPNHAIMVDLLQKVKDDPNDDKAKKSVEILLPIAFIEQGWDLSNPTNLASNVYGLMSERLGVDLNEPIKEIELPEDEEEEEEEEDKEDEEKEKKDKHEEL